MTQMMLRIAVMSIQAALMIAVIFGMRKLFAWVHISKTYVMMLWMVLYSFLIFPWKVAVPQGFWTFTDQRLIQEDTELNLENAKMQQTQDLQLKNVQNAENGVRQKKVGASGKLSRLWKIYDTVQKRILNAEYDEDSMVIHVLTMIWMSGCLFLILGGMLSYGCLRWLVRCSVRCEDAGWSKQAWGLKDTAVYVADAICTPMVLGYFRPCIFLPYDIDVSYREYVIAHEMTHIQRKDHLIKAAAYVITCLHWFDPLVWLAYAVMAKDMEMACDEQALSKIGMANKKAYASALLELSADRGNGLAIPPAFGKGDIKVRIWNIMHYKRTSKTAGLAAAAAVIVLAGIFLMVNRTEGVQTAVHANQNANEWLTLELPDGYTLGSYDESIGYIGGELIYPQSYQANKESENTPKHWKYSGFIGAVGEPQEVFVFENGKLNELYYPQSNHSMEEPAGVREDISPGDGWMTLMVHGFHDLYTAAELVEMETSGTDLSQLEIQSEYWYFYFVKEGYDHAYMLSLSAKEFSQSEAVETAKTVRMMEEKDE